MRKSAAKVWQGGLLALLALLVLALVPQPSGLDSTGPRISQASTPEGSGASPGQPGTPAQKLFARAQGDSSKLRTDSLAAVSTPAGTTPLLRVRAAAASRSDVFNGLLLASARFGRAPPVPSFL